MRVVVTGGAGFIGSCYVRMLLGGQLELPSGTRLSEVVVLDAFTYAGNPANLEPVQQDPRLRIVRANICDADAVRGLLRAGDHVVHFAAETHVDRSIAGPAGFVQTNVLGTQVLLQSAMDAGVARLVHVSTDEVYGDITHGAWQEDQPLRPNSPYSASKASSDLLALSYHHTYGLPVVLTRCSNNYGPYQYPEKVIPLFVTNLLEQVPVPLYGDGENVRDWLHVADHCRGVAMAAARGRLGEVYHIGGGIQLSNRELTELLLTAVGADWTMVRMVPDRQGHDRRYALNIDKIRTELGYAPSVDFRGGLADVVRWYTERADWWRPLRAATR